MPSSLKKAGIKVLLALLVIAKFLGVVLLTIIKGLSLPFIWLWKFCLRPLTFLSYRLFIRLRTATDTMFVPVRSTIMAVFGNRYVVHSMMFLILVFVATTSLYARQADLGEASKDSLVYTLTQEYGNALFQQAGTDSESGNDLGIFSASSTDEVLSYDQTGVAKPLPPPPGSNPATTPPPPPRPTGSKPTTYIVVDGDTISGIAKKYGLSVSTVLWANGMTARSLLKIGQSLTILPVDGITHTITKGETVSSIAKKFGGDITQILNANQLASADQIHVGEVLIIPDGTPPAVPVPPPPPRLGDIKNVFKSPTEAPASRAQISGSRNLSWPTDQHLINQYFHYGHPGVDINGNLQASIYAADDGTVTTAGWNKGGYGNMVLIDHGDGMVTRYGHASVLFVHVGDHVTKGQVIGMVGSTGHSTGPHLHFEVYLGGVRRNPLEFYK